MQEISEFSDNGLPNSLGLYKVFSIRACRYTTSAQVPKCRTPSLRMTEYTVIRQGVRSHFPPPLLVTCKTCHGPAQFGPHLKVLQPKAQSRWREISRSSIGISTGEYSACPMPARCSPTQSNIELKTWFLFVPWRTLLRQGWKMIIDYQRPDSWPKCQDHGPSMEYECELSVFVESQCCALGATGVHHLRVDGDILGDPKRLWIAVPRIFHKYWVVQLVV